MNLVLDISFAKIDFNFNFSYAYVWVCTHVNAGAHSLKRVLDPYLGTGITGNCELPDVGAGN